MDAVATNSVFYSGGPAALNAATEYANSTGGMTLGMTETGQYLNTLYNGGLDYGTQIRPLADIASKDFASNAVGDVNVFINWDKYDPSGIWNTIEWPALIKNPNVTDIIYHDVTP